MYFFLLLIFLLVIFYLYKIKCYLKYIIKQKQQSSPQQSQPQLQLQPSAPEEEIEYNNNDDDDDDKKSITTNLDKRIFDSGEDKTSLYYTSSNLENRQKIIEKK